MATIVITDMAAEHLVGTSYSVEELLAPSLLDAQLPVRTREGDTTFIASGREREDFKYAVIDADELRKLPQSDMRHALPRIDRALKATARFPLRLPPSWGEYHAGNKVAFFALPREIKGGFRWIAEYDSGDNRLLFRRITNPGAEIQLESYSEPYPSSERNRLKELISIVSKGKKPGEDKRSTSLVETFDFEVVGAYAISSAQTLEQWIPRLKGGQKSLIDLPTLASARVIGPAGSGKTLALCIRALMETRAANSAGRRTKILFVTHSWAMAERVDSSIQALNGHRPTSDIVVLPLIQALKLSLAETYAGSLSVLGDDSTEGRQLQLELLGDVVSSISQADIDAFARHGLSREIVNRLQDSTADKVEMLNDLCEEFNGVLLPENVVPGDRDAEEKYLMSERSDEMPPFRSRGDRMFSLFAYRGYLKSLREWGAITTDQLVNDAIRVLETFSWSVRRDVEGFDEIFVDELQLFDAQERVAITLLSRNPSSATFVTAEDPSQGVFSAVSARWRRELPARSQSKTVQLSTVHRFNGRILAFIRHLYLSFPLNANSVSVDPHEAPETGTVPVLHHLATGEQVEKAVIEAARRLSGGLSKGERLAIITLDSSATLIADALGKILNVVLITSFDDVEKLTYARRAIVVGNWQFVGGTQFSRVLVSSRRIGAGTSAFARMKELISLYVAASRASDCLEIVVSGSLPSELKAASSDGVISIVREG